jgi:hypothetical protein
VCLLWGPNLSSVCSLNARSPVSNTLPQYRAAIAFPERTRGHCLQKFGFPVISLLSTTTSPSPLSLFTHQRLTERHQTTRVTWPAHPLLCLLTQSATAFYLITQSVCVLLLITRQCCHLFAYLDDQAVSTPDPSSAGDWWHKNSISGFSISPDRNYIFLCIHFFHYECDAGNLKAFWCLQKTFYTNRTLCPALTSSAVVSNVNGSLQTYIYTGSLLHLMIIGCRFLSVRLSQLRRQTIRSTTHAAE